MIIVAAADDNYALPLCVMLESVLFHLKHKESNVSIYILSSGINLQNKSKINRVAEKYSKNIKLCWLEFSTNNFGEVRYTKQISKAAYLRVKIPDLLPKEIEKVIYLDCDIIVQRDLTELWSIDVNDYAAAGVQDFYTPLVSSPGGLSEIATELGIPQNTIYCNSGVMIINLKFWRENKIPDRIIEYAVHNRDRMNRNDQEAINAIISGNWLVLDPRWNFTISSVAVYNDNKQNFQFNPLPKLEVLQAEQYIIHYTSEFKPWKIWWSFEANIVIYFNQKYWEKYYFHFSKSQYLSQIQYLRRKFFQKIALTIFKINRRV